MEGKYGRVTVEGKDIPEDEPLFLLRGQDLLAPGVVWEYAKALRAECLDEQATQVERWFGIMYAWQIDHPDRVKYPD